MKKKGKDMFALGTYLFENGDKTPKKPETCLGRERKSGSCRLQMKKRRFLRILPKWLSEHELKPLQALKGRNTLGTDTAHRQHDMCTKIHILKAQADLDIHEGLAW